MSLFQTIFLAIIQGITEFLPISSSAHLILTSYLMDWQDQGAGFDLALHIGTLLAVVMYFRQDVITLIHDGVLSLFKRQTVGQSRLAWLLVYATFPALLFGYFLLDIVDTLLRSPWIIVVTTFCYALLLWYADKTAKLKKTLTKINLKEALIVGFAQALALIPGTSRSGITITVGLLLGYSREAASRFSFLLAIPITLAATVGKISNDAIQHSDINWGLFSLGAVIAFVTAILAIHYFLKLLNRFGMMPYVIYRLILAAIIALTLLST